MFGLLEERFGEDGGDECADAEREVDAVQVWSGIETPPRVQAKNISTCKI
jgi:hypothetical protein